MVTQVASTAIGAVELLKCGMSFEVLYDFMYFVRFGLETLI